MSEANRLQWPELKSVSELVLELEREKDDLFPILLDRLGCSRVGLVGTEVVSGSWENDLVMVSMRDGATLALSPATI